MAKFRTIKNSFSAGQISPTSFGRTDLPQYAHASRTMLNMIPMISGGAYRRPGTFLENTIVDSSLQYVPRIIPFIFSRTEAYALTFGKTIGGTGYFNSNRSVSNTGPSLTILQSGSHPYNIAIYSNRSIAYDEIHDVNYTQSADIMTLVHPNHKPKRVYRTATDTFVIQDFDAAYPINNPTYISSSDVGASAYGAGAALRDAWPYLDQNQVASLTLTPDATTGTWTAPGNGVLLTASAAFFNSGHVGAIFKLNPGGAGTKYGAIQIKEYLTSTTVRGTVIVDLQNTSATSVWWESAWSDYRGWPSSVVYHNHRLCYGGSTHEPDTIYLSNIDNYNQMSVAQLVTSTFGSGSNRSFLSTPPPNSSSAYVAYIGAYGVDPFKITLSSNQLNILQWMISDKILYIGTSSDEFEIKNGNNGFGADSYDLEPSTHFGSINQQPIRCGSEFITIKQSGQEVRLLNYDYLQQSYSDGSVQSMFDEYPKVEATFGNRKYRAAIWDLSRKTMWCIDTAGNLFGLTHDKATSFSAWHVHQLGGYDATRFPTLPTVFMPSTVTDNAYYTPTGSVLSIAMVPNPILGVDDLWMVVKRYVTTGPSAGNYTYSIERMIGGFTVQDTAYGIQSANANGVGNYLVDSATYNTNAYTFPGTASYNIAGGVSFAGQSLSGTAFNTKGIFVVNTSALDNAGNGILTDPIPGNFDGEGTTSMVGVNFTSVVEPVRPEVGSQIGTAQGASKRIHEIFLRFYKTMSAKIGSSQAKTEEIQFREGSTPLQNSAELFTGDKRIKFISDYDRDGYVTIMQDQPLPFCVVSFTAEGMTYD